MNYEVNIRLQNSQKPFPTSYIWVNTAFRKSKVLETILIIVNYSSNEMLVSLKGH